jgi:hypothetical protein
MRARHTFLREHSLHTVLSAIEIYNKPDFKEREQIFAILVVTAWEALLKAKILKDNSNKLKALYIKQGRGYKPNRTGGYLTIGIEEAIRQCSLPQVVAENIRHLIHIRDAAIHLTAASPSLPYLTFVLGIATLSNYSRLIRDWFGIGLSDYNFYILPLSFSYPFQTISPIELRKEPKDIAAILNQVAWAQAEGNVQDGEFFLICEIHTALVSAKKITQETDLVASVKAEGEKTVIMQRPVKLLDQYPYTYTQVWKRIKVEIPRLMQHQLNALIKEKNIKGDPKYSTYSFRSKLEETRGASAGTPVIYNEDFARFALLELSQSIADWNRGIAQHCHSEPAAAGEESGAGFLL